MRETIKRTIQEIILEEELNKNDRKIANDIFNKIPELSKYGTVEEYLDYLDNIFPDTKVNQIVYHGGTLNPSDRGKDSFTGEYGGKHGIYFTGSNSRAKSYINAGNKEYKSKSKIYFAILNIERPLDKKIWSKWRFNADTITDAGLEEMRRHNSDGIIVTDLFSKYLRIKYNTQYVVLDMKQVHILGSREDIQGFKRHTNR